MPESNNHRVFRIITRIGRVADNALSKITWFVLISALASAVIAFKLYSADSAVWWNIIKCGLIMLPACIWGGLWLVLNQLRDAPELMSDLAQDEDGVFTNLQDVSLREPDGLRGVYATLNAFRKEDGLAVIFDTIGGLTMIINPLFAIVAFITMLILILFLLIALAILVL